MNLFWNVLDRELVGGVDDTSVLSRLDLVLRDLESLVVAVMEPQETGNAYLPRVLATPESGIAFGIKSATSATSYLAYTATFAASGTGATTRYTGSLDLNVDALIALVEASTDTEDDRRYVDVVAEITCTGTDGRDRYSTAIPCRIYEDVITSASSVASANPGSAVRFYTDPVTGAKGLQLFNADGVLLQTVMPPA